MPSSAPSTPLRSVLHVDMDAFYAAVEVLDRPSLRGKPVIVGGTAEGHGVVSTASYEARRFGVRSAMPAAEAVRLCPGGVFLRPRMERYAVVSRQIFAVFSEVTPQVEGLSLDEAFLDLTGSPGLRVEARAAGARQAARRAARALQARVEEVTGGLTCSVGLAENKLLAKIASDLRKPRGLVEVPEGQGEAFLAPLPVERLWGVGPKTRARLLELGIETIGALARVALQDLEGRFGREHGRHLHEVARGHDDRPVASRAGARSISQETTLATFIPSGQREHLERLLFELSDGVSRRLREEGLHARTIRLKVRDEAFRTVTRSRTLDAPTQLLEELFSVSKTLLFEGVQLGRRRIRLLGIAAAGLTREALRQLDLFSPETARESQCRLADLTARIRQRLGDDAIVRGRLLPPR